MSDTSASLDAAQMLQWATQRKFALLNRKAHLFSPHHRNEDDKLDTDVMSDDIVRANKLISSIISGLALNEIQQREDGEFVNNHIVDELQKTIDKSINFLEILRAQDTTILESMGDGLRIIKSNLSQANEQLSALSMSDCSIVQTYVQNMSAIDHSVSVANLSGPAVSDFDDKINQLGGGIIEKSQCILYFDSSLPFI
jgi:hypothetical protein